MDDFDKRMTENQIGKITQFKKEKKRTLKRNSFNDLKQHKNDNQEFVKYYKFIYDQNNDATINRDDKAYLHKHFNIPNNTKKVKVFLNKYDEIKETKETKRKSRLKKYGDNLLSDINI